MTTVVEAIYEDGRLRLLTPLALPEQARVRLSVEPLPTSVAVGLAGDAEATCYDRVRDLFEEPGRLGASGKGDLSTNKAHLGSFGRPVRENVR